MKYIISIIIIVITILLYYRSSNQIEYFNPHYVHIYQYCGFAGKNIKLAAKNISDITVFGIENISSLKLGPETVVELYEEKNFKGKQLRLINFFTVEKDKYSCLKKNHWNYRAKSLKIRTYDEYIKNVKSNYYEKEKTSAYGILHKECNFNDQGVKLKVGKYTTNDLKSFGIKDNSINGFKLGPQSVIIFFEEDNFQGNWWRFINSDFVNERENSCLVNDKWYNIISSLIIIPYDTYVNRVNKIPDPYLYIYGNCNFIGPIEAMGALGYKMPTSKYYILSQSDYTYQQLINMGIGEDKFSIRIGPYTALGLYSKPNYKGNLHMIINESKINEKAYQCLTYKFKSMQLLSFKQYERLKRPYCIFYFYCDFEGLNTRVDIGEYNLKDIKAEIGESTVKSVVLGPRSVLQVFSESDYKGQYWVMINPSEKSTMSNKCLKKSNFIYDIKSLKIVPYNEFISKLRPYIFVYDECHFMSNSYKFTKGFYLKYNLSKKKIFNPSSFKIGPRTVTEFYQKDAFGGLRWKVVNKYPDRELSDRCFINTKHNKIVNSMKVYNYDEYVKNNPNILEPGIIVYSKCNFSGKKIHLKIGKYTLVDLNLLGIKGETIKSIELGPYTGVNIYDKSQFNGKVWEMKNMNEFEIMGHQCLSKWKINSLIVVDLTIPKLKPLYRGYDSVNKDTCMAIDNKPKYCPNNTGWNKIGCIIQYPQTNKTTNIYHGYNKRVKDTCIGTDNNTKWCHDGMLRGDWDIYGYAWKTNKKNTVPLYRAYKTNRWQNNTTDTCFSVGDQVDDCYNLPLKLRQKLGYIYPPNMC